MLESPPAMRPGHQSEALPSPRLKNLQPHLRPIVLAENLGQGHWGGERLFLLLLPWKSQDRGPGRSLGNQLAPLGWSPASMSRGGGRAGGQAGSSGRCGVRGLAGRTAAALITPALQVPISFEKDSRDAAFNNYQ